MGLFATLSNTLGAVLLIHAVYSAYEHSQLRTTKVTTAADATSNPNDLPLDITLETLFSIILISVGLVFGSPDFRPIQWRTWAGQTEREKSGEPRSLDDQVLSKPFLGLEQRTGFLDIRAKRREYTAWKTASATKA